MKHLISLTVILTACLILAASVYAAGDAGGKTYQRCPLGMKAPALTHPIAIPQSTIQTNPGAFFNKQAKNAVQSSGRNRMRSPEDMATALAAGAAYLMTAQSATDGGWDAVLTGNTHSVNPSSASDYGTAAMGLYYSYLRTGDPAIFNAMTLAANNMTANAAVVDGFALRFLMLYNDLPGVTGTAYKDAAKAKYDAAVAAHGGTATGLATYLRDLWGVTLAMHNGVIAWDLGSMTVATQMLFARYGGTYNADAVAIAEVMYQASFVANVLYFDLTRCAGWDPTGANPDFWWYNLGLTGLIDAFSATGAHTVELPGLLTKLMASQGLYGGFCGSYGVHVDVGINDMDWQTTAYAVLTLSNQSRAIYGQAIDYATYYLAGTQDANGGWVYANGSSQPGVGGAATAALFYSAPGIAYVSAAYTPVSAGGHVWGYDAFALIQDGVNAVANGGAVNVAAGTYDEQVVVNGKDITLTGAGNTTVIRPSGAVKLASVYTYPVTVPVNAGTGIAGIVTFTNGGIVGSTISGLQIDGSLVTALPAGATKIAGLVVGEAQAAIDNVTVTTIKMVGYANPSIGIDVSASAAPQVVTISNSTITDFGGAGVLANGGALTAYVINNTITGPGTISTQVPYGIEFLSGVDGAISGNIVSALHYGVANSFRSCGITELNTGVAGVVVENNEVFNADDGICILNGMTVQNNNLHNNGIGISLDGGAANNTFTGNVITANTIAGVQINGVLNPNPQGQVPPGAGNVFSNNEISGNAAGAISYDNTATFGLTGNWWGAASGPFHATLNAAGTANSVSNFIAFDPWTGKPLSHAINGASLNTPLVFNNTTVTFSTLPSGLNGTLTVQTLPVLPAGLPAPPSIAGTVEPLFVQISSTGLANGSFNATVTIDVSAYPNFSPGTQLMYFSLASNSWIGIPGTFQIGPPATFTFTTTHLAVFAFVNPMNSLATSLTLDPLNTAANIYYPVAGAGTGTKYSADDWTYAGQQVTLYVVPTGTQPIVATNFTILWDATKATLASATQGNLFASPLFTTSSPAAGQLVVQTGNLGGSINVTPAAGKYLAKVIFTITKPGYNQISLDNVDFRFFVAGFDTQAHVFVTTTPAEVKLYLGDFANAVNMLSGDGLIDFNDLSPFALSYWSLSSGTPAGYAAKYDVGPTNTTGSYFALPTPDGKVEFEDLVIFAIGYGKSAAAQLTKQVARPVTLALDNAIQTGNTVRVPIMLAGPVNDVRAFSIALQAKGLTFTGVEKAGEMNHDYCFMMSKADGGNVTIDGAVLGSQHTGLSKAGVIAYATFTGNGSVSFGDVKARTSNNEAITVNTTGVSTVGHAIPTSYLLEQNYPNPFNPTTNIHYALPNDGHVKIVVYNLLGAVVATLVDADQAAGSYDVRWDGTNANHQAVSSGMYLYKIQAGDFTSIKKMTIMK